MKNLITLLICAAILCSASIARAASPDGSMLKAGAAGSLVTTAGTWTFGAVAPNGNSSILLGGVLAANGYGIEMVVANGGQLYVLNVQTQWWRWSSSGWEQASSPLSSISILKAGTAGSLVTTAGTWTFGAVVSNVNSSILLGGVSAAGGYGIEMVVANGGEIYVLNAGAQWWLWIRSGWHLTSSPLAPVTITVPGQGTGKTYYVSTTGKDSNSGTSTTTPFATIAHAASLTNAGDVVNVMAGTYPSFTISRSGSATAYISFQGYPAGTHPVIQESTSDWEGIYVLANYTSVNGFEVIGDSASITQSQANNENLNSAQLNDGGIGIGDYSGSPIYHHAIVSNNIVHNTDQNGISIGKADYVTITGNTVYNNSNWSGYAGSGISITPQDSDSNTGYKIYITGNLVYDNVELVINTGNGSGLGITDGEGIIVDSNTNTNYGGRTYIANNITYNNGSEGIEVFNSKHVDIVNNTTYEDNTNLKDGEITVSVASDVNGYNNIMYGTSDGAASGGFTTSNYNDYFNTTPTKKGANDIESNPDFVNAASYNFQLQAGSPCINSGTSNLAPATDFAGTPRPQGGAYDMGAYE